MTGKILCQNIAEVLSSMYVRIIANISPSSLRIISKELNRCEEIIGNDVAGSFPAT
jgi:hypothetical protein